MEHSILPPSSAHIWGAENGCIAWVKMNQQYPEPEEPSVESAEGTAAHEVGENQIRKGLNWDFIPLPEGSTASNGVIITYEMVENAEIYSNDVLETFNNMKDKKMVKIGIESTGPIKRIHLECFGTKDTWMYDVVANVLYIWDFKFGHSFVEVFEWLQGICYAAGLMDEISLRPDTLVVFKIVQPRAYSSEGPVREWRVKLSELFPFFERLAAKAAAALNDGMFMQTGPHCKNCYPRFACFPALNAGMILYEVASAPQTHALSNGALGLQLLIIERALEQLKSLKNAFDGQVEATIKQGNSVPGWGLKESKGREVWTKPIDEVIAMGKMLGVPVEKPGAITPNQARKAGMLEDILSAYAGRNKNGLKLVKDNGMKARKAFSYNESKKGV